MPIIGGTGASSGPGTELGYDQITATVSVVGTTSGTATTIITCAAHNFNGSAVMLEFFAPTWSAPAAAAGTIEVGLFETGALITALAFAMNTGAVLLYEPCNGRLRFTPTNGSHTYVIGAWVSATTGTPNVTAGTGTAGAFAPSYARFTAV